MKSGMWMLGGLLLAVCAVGCGTPPVRIHFATATEAQLEVQSTPVWFEFRKGDNVPLGMLFTGVVEGGAPIVAVAKQTFWLVVERNAPPRFSFDGKNVVSQDAGMVALALHRAGNQNNVGVVVYLGKPEDAPPELKKH